MERAARGDVERWPLPAPSVSAELLLRLAKYRDPTRVPEPIVDAARAAAAEASGLVRPEAVVWHGPLARVDETEVALLGGAVRLHGRALGRLLADAVAAYVVVLTVGPAVEERAHGMFEEQMFLEAFLMDTAGWAAIELLVRDVRRRLRDAERAAGRDVTHRLGPGHADWPLTEQPALLRVFGDTPLPVQLNEAACMVPQKSISGIFGVVGT